MAKKLAGIIAPITTPFVNEDVSLEHLKSNMRKYRDTGVAGFFAIGINHPNRDLGFSQRSRDISQSDGHVNDPCCQGVAFLENEIRVD